MSWNTFQIYKLQKTTCPLTNVRKVLDFLVRKRRVSGLIKKKSHDRLKQTQLQLFGALMRVIEIKYVLENCLSALLDTLFVR